jgi:hypothetical protein
MEEQRHTHENLNASSVEMSSNQGGGVSITVKVYHADAETAALKAARLHDELRERYPAVKK